jgi:hypothetical protein
MSTHTLCHEEIGIRALPVTTANLLPVESVVVYAIAITALSIELREFEPIKCIAV